jgi:hypothetical protein
VETKKTTINISADMHEAVRRQAKQRGATMSGLIRVVLGEWLEAQGERGNWDVELPGGYRREGEA